jgi:hypothetical protein
MNYTVSWSRSAEDELAAIWLASSRRSDVTKAAQALDGALRSRPFDVGESRMGDFRIHFSEPLGILYRVLPAQHRVLVAHVWVFN